MGLMEEGVEEGEEEREEEWEKVDKLENNRVGWTEQRFSGCSNCLEAKSSSSSSCCSENSLETWASVSLWLQD